MIIVDANLKKPIKIGKLGENEARMIRFPVGDILKEFPGVSFSLLNKRPNDPDAYPVPSENYVVDGNYLLWTVTSGDVAQKGNGECEIVASKDGEIVKDEIYCTETERALDGSGTPPDPWQSWVEDVEEAAEDAENAAQRAEEAAQALENVNFALAGEQISDNKYRMYIERV